MPKQRAVSVLQQNIKIIARKYGGSANLGIRLKKRGIKSYVESNGVLLGHARKILR